MARLPVVGDDPGAWGDILNEYLAVAHNPDGTLIGGGSAGVEYNVVDYGAELDGTTDDSGAIQAAIDACHAAGGGIVVIPGRVFSPGSTVKINTTLNVRAGVWLRGIGGATSLTGTANPMIQLAQIDEQDRVTISDLYLQSPVGAGVKIDTQGAFQLGWARVTVQNVTVVDATTHAFWNLSGAIEVRFINCVSLRAGQRGFNCVETDNFFLTCTAAESGEDGFNISGGNNKITGCKAYGNDIDGFALAGAGRHVLAGCESQDNGKYGYRILGTFNTLAGCLADSDNLAGVAILNDDNTVNGSFMYGGGGSGQVTKAGVFFGVGTERNVVSGVSNCAAPVGGKAEGNTVYLKSGPGSRVPVTYTATWTPNPYDGEIQAMTLTGNLTLVNPVYKHVGQRMALELTQDGTGGRTTTFPAEFRTSWTPSTTGTHLNVISFVYDGTAWQQTGSVVGLTPKTSIGRADTFNRADGALGTSSSGHLWTTYAGGGGTWSVVSNQCKLVGGSQFTTNAAVLDALVPDYTVQVTAVTHAVFAGLVWRYSDSSNFYQVAGNSLNKFVAGVNVSVTSGTFNFVSGDVIKVVVSGPNHFIYQNGTLVFVFSDNFNITATKAGVAAGGTSDILDAFTIV